MRPRVVTRPEVGRMMEPMILSSVDLPDPLCPMRPTDSFSPTSTLTESRARNSLTRLPEERRMRSLTEVSLCS